MDKSTNACLRAFGRGGPISGPLKPGPLIQTNQEDSLIKAKIIAFAVALLWGAYGVAIAAEQGHAAQALEHANAAVTHGEQKHADVLTQHAEEALKHAEAAQKEKANPHLEQGITHLKAAIEHGKLGHADVATGHAKEAVTHLKAAQ